MMAEIAVPIHEDAGCTENRKTDSKKEPDHFASHAPDCAEVQGVHGPHNPVAGGVILAIVPVEPMRPGVVGK